MNVLSLFDGLSGGQIALNRANIKYDKYYASEINPNSIKITQKNYPDTIQLGDVTLLDEEKIKQLGKIDLLIFGFPCEDVSIIKSKTRESLKGKKSGLFFEAIRIKDLIKPKWFMVENVASMNEESKNIITKYIGVDPIVINSSNFSAQDRERYYWTNIPLGDLPEDKGLILKDIMETNVVEKQYYKQPFEFHGWDKKVIATVQLKCHDMGKRVYNPNMKCATLTAIQGGYQEKKVYDNNRCRKLTPIEYERLQTIEDDYTKLGTNIYYQIFDNKLNGGLINICNYALLKDVLIKSQVEKQNYVINTILDLKDTTQQNSQETSWIKASNVRLKVVKENKKLPVATVSCIIKEKKERGILNYLIKLLLNATIVMEWQSQEECVKGIIKLGTDTAILYTPIKIGQTQILMDTQNLRGNIRSYIEKLPIKNLGEDSSEEKLFIMLTLINWITINLIYTSVKETKNILVYINNLTVLQEDLLNWDISYLRTENIELISDTARRSACGDGWTIDVITFLFNNIT